MKRFGERSAGGRGEIASSAAGDELARQESWPEERAQGPHAHEIEAEDFIPELTRDRTERPPLVVDFLLSAGVAVRAGEPCAAVVADAVGPAYCEAETVVPQVHPKTTRSGVSANRFIGFPQRLHTAMTIGPR